MGKNGNVQGASYKVDERVVQCVEVEQADAGKACK